MKTTIAHLTRAHNQSCFKRRDWTSHTFTRRCHEKCASKKEKNFVLPNARPVVSYFTMQTQRAISLHSTWIEFELARKRIVHFHLHNLQRFRLIQVRWWRASSSRLSFRSIEIHSMCIHRNFNAPTTNNNTFFSSWQYRYADKMVSWKVRNRSCRSQTQTTRWLSFWLRFRKWNTLPRNFWRNVHVSNEKLKRKNQ